MRAYGYTVFFEPLAEGGFNVIVPAIPEICTSGETLEEARWMAEDAIGCYLESAQELHEAFPDDLATEHEPIKEPLSIEEFLTYLA